MTNIISTVAIGQIQNTKSKVILKLNRNSVVLVKRPIQSGIPRVWTIYLNFGFFLRKQVQEKYHVGLVLPCTEKALVGSLVMDIEQLTDKNISMQRKCEYVKENP